MELALSHPSDVKNFEVASAFLENLCVPAQEKNKSCFNSVGLAELRDVRSISR
jgi:hypothetical protein